MKIGNYPPWILDHKGEQVTVKEWLEIIVDYYPSDFVHHLPGRPSMLSKEIVLQLPIFEKQIEKAGAELENFRIRGLDLNEGRLADD